MRSPNLDEYDNGTADSDEINEAFDALEEDVQDYIEYVREHSE